MNRPNTIFYYSHDTSIINPYSACEDPEDKLLSLWNEIWDNSLKKILMQRYLVPRKTFEEILLTLRAAKRRNKAKWFDKDVFKAVRKDLNNQITPEHFEFLKHYEKQLKIFKDSLWTADSSLDFVIHLAESLMKNYSPRVAYDYWIEQLSNWISSLDLGSIDDLRSDEINILEKITNNLVAELFLHGYSHEFIISFGIQGRGVDTEKAEQIITEYFSKVGFQQREFAIHFLFKGEIRKSSKEENSNTEDAKGPIYEYENFVIYDPLSGWSGYSFEEEVANAPLIAIAELEQKENNTHTFAVRVLVGALDFFAAIKRARREICDLLNSFDPWELNSLSELHTTVFIPQGGFGSFSLHSKVFEGLFLPEEDLKNYCGWHERAKGLDKNTSVRFTDFLQRVERNKRFFTPEDALVDVWIALETLLGEPNSPIANSRVIQEIAPLICTLIRPLWETQEFLLQLQCIPSIAEILMDHSKNLALTVDELRKKHLIELKDRICGTIDSPYLKQKFQVFCNEKNEDLLKRLEEKEKSIKTDLLIITIVRNTIVHGSSLIFECDLLFEKLKMMARGTYSVLLNLCYKGQITTQKAILTLKELHSYLKLSLKSDPNFAADSNFLEWMT